MKKLLLICILVFTQSALAVNLKSSHPIYFTAGDVKPHELAIFELPANQMILNAYYNMSCQVTVKDIKSFKPIIYVKIEGDFKDFNSRIEPEAIFNGVLFRYPFQDKLISESNVIVINNILYNNYYGIPLTLKVYNFDDEAPITLSNCQMIVSSYNA